MDTRIPGWCSMTLALSLAACGGPTGGGAAALPAGDAEARAAPAHAVPCGEHVKVHGRALRVTPSGGEDTAALQCALDRADGRTIRLAPGTFHVAQLVADHFVGELVGAGEGRTTITNVDRALPVTPVGYSLALPGADNPWPTLVTFVGGWFRVAHLTIQVSGAAPATPWTGVGSMSAVEDETFLFSVVALTGAPAVAAFDHVTIRGETTAGDGLGYGVNVLNGIDAQQFLGAEPAPLALWLSVRDSTFDTLASAVPAGNLRHADVSISGCRLGTLVGGELFDLSHVRYRFTGNDVRSPWVGLIQYDVCQAEASACGLDDVRLHVAGNQFTGAGVVLDGTFGEDVTCRVVGNDFDAIEGLYHPGLELFLGAGTHGCLATGITAFEDLGTGNRVLP